MANKKTTYIIIGIVLLVIVIPAILVILAALAGILYTMPR
jgi:hypothetical protein